MLHVTCCCVVEWSCHMLFETCYHNFTDSSLYDSEVRTCTVGRLDEYCGEVGRPRPTVNPLGGSGVRLGTPVGMVALGGMVACLCANCEQVQQFAHVKGWIAHDSGRWVVACLP